jgi:hypothetical protein
MQIKIMLTLSFKKTPLNKVSTCGGKNEWINGLQVITTFLVQNMGIFWGLE